jgi:protocatechuate 3,4-dioxygenase beta subunit
MRIPGIAITIGEGENVTNVDLALVRGGVVTGKITDPDGHPLIEQFVQLDRLDAQGNPTPLYPLINASQYVTDDRGIYRIFGVLPGQYRVSAGEGNGAIMRTTSGRKAYARTFHPDATEVSQATIIEIGEAREMAGVDIRVRAAIKTYAIAGRTVDAETNEPVTNVEIVAGVVRPDWRVLGSLGAGATGTGGEFRIDGVRPDRYRIWAGNGSMTRSANSGYSDQVPVEVVDGDVTGVEIRVKRGGTISGVAVVEGATDPEILATLLKQRITVFVMPKESGTTIAPQAVQIASDGSFRAQGLEPGKANFSHVVGVEGSLGLSLLRVERDGVRVDSIEIGPGEQVRGIRVVFGYGTGSVHGQVIVKGGSLPEGSFVWIGARRSDGFRPRGARTDARGTFAVEGLPPGQYEFEAQLQGPRSREVSRPKQTVTVTNGQTAQVTLTIDVSQPERKP